MSLATPPMVPHEENQHTVEGLLDLFNDPVTHLTKEYSQMVDFFPQTPSLARYRIHSQLHRLSQRSPKLYDLRL